MPAAPGPPIGDVTTTMLWIGGQITPLAIMKGVFIPSLINLLRAVAGRQLHPARPGGRRPGAASAARARADPRFERNLMFFMGLGILIAVPVFKTRDASAALHGHPVRPRHSVARRRTGSPRQGRRAKQHLTLVARADADRHGSIVFFIGILLAVATLEHTHILSALAQWLDHDGRPSGRHRAAHRPVSAVVDNVPLVAASMGMYSWPVSARQLPVGVHRLLRRHRRIDPDHRLGCRRGGDGAGEDPFLLVPTKISGWPCSATPVAASPTSFSIA